MGKPLEAARQLPEARFDSTNKDYRSDPTVLVEVKSGGLWRVSGEGACFWGVALNPKAGNLMQEPGVL